MFGYTRLFSTMLGYTRLYSTLLGYNWLNSTMLGCTRLNSVMPRSNKLTLVRAITLSGLLLSHKCLSQDTTYFRMSARTFESMLGRSSKIRVKVIGGMRTTLSGVQYTRCTCAVGWMDGSMSTRKCLRVTTSYDVIQLGWMIISLLYGHEEFSLRGHEMTTALKNFLLFLSFDASCLPTGTHWLRGEWAGGGTSKGESHEEGWEPRVYSYGHKLLLTWLTEIQPHH